MQALNAKVRTLQHLGRVEHFDSDGGGRIVRSIYCEPYTAHKRVCTALKGTVYDAGGNRWERAKPHADPLYPWFYCSDVQVEPMHPASSRSSRDMNFNAGAADQKYGKFNVQFDSIQAALNRVDDYDAAELIHNLTPAEIAAGGIADANQNEFKAESQIVNTEESLEIGEFQSRGRCGARITATYVPLIFQPGLSSIYGPGENADPFDFVDPQWEPLTLTTATGRTLWLFSPSSNPLAPAGSSQLHFGLNDTFPLSEVVWRFSVRRLMIPFLPQYTIAAFSNKLNKFEMKIGGDRFPPGTVRMETPDVMQRRAPDGNVYWDLRLKFLIRRLWDEYWEPKTGFGDGSFKKGYVGWNWAYAAPRVGFADNPLDLGSVTRACYYPVCWNSGLFNFFGTNHPLYLHDQDVTQGDGNIIPNWTDLTNVLGNAPFRAGHYRQQ